VAEREAGGVAIVGDDARHGQAGMGGEPPWAACPRRPAVWRRFPGSMEDELAVEIAAIHVA
jgi:hypothetical protein